MCFEYHRVIFHWKKWVKIFIFAYSQGRGDLPPPTLIDRISPGGADLPPPCANAYTRKNQWVKIQIISVYYISNVLFMVKKLFRLVEEWLCWLETPYFHNLTLTIGAKVATQGRNVRKRKLNCKPILEQVTPSRSSGKSLGEDLSHPVPSAKELFILCHQDADTIVD